MEYPTIETISSQALQQMQGRFNDYPAREYIQANGNGAHPTGMKIQSNLYGDIEQFIRERHRKQRTYVNTNDIGDSVAVNEGQDIPIAKLTSTTDKVKVAKIGKAVEFSDEAVLSAFNGIGGGDGVAEEAAKQILVATNSGVENLLINKMNTSATLTGNIPSSGDPADAIGDALVKFGEDIDGDKVLAIPPEFYAKLRNSKSWIPNTEIGADVIIRGVVGMVHGCQIITANRLRAHSEYTKTTDATIKSGKTYYVFSNNAYVAAQNPEDEDLPFLFEKTDVPNTSFIIKPGALAIFMKRDTLVEFDRDIISEMNYIKGSKIFAPYVYDKSKLIKLTHTA